MKKKKNLEDCRNDDFTKAYDCVMDLIASKMHCKNKLEKSYSPEHYPLCQSKEDMKMYIQTRRKIYNGSYDEEIKHCFKKRCIEEFWTAHYQGPMTKELLHQNWQYKDQDNMAVIVLLLQNEVNSILLLLIINIYQITTHTTSKRTKY